ncbi:hypothetical protein BHM03_00025417, partial [Ensete ventricosum]
LVTSLALSHIKQMLCCPPRQLIGDCQLTTCDWSGLVDPGILGAFLRWPHRSEHLLLLSWWFLNFYCSRPPSPALVDLCLLATHTFAKLYITGMFDPMASS